MKHRITFNPCIRSTLLPAMATPTWKGVAAAYVSAFAIAFLTIVVVSNLLALNPDRAFRLRLLEKPEYYHKQANEDGALFVTMHVTHDGSSVIRYMKWRESDHGNPELQPILAVIGRDHHEDNERNLAISMVAYDTESLPHEVDWSSSPPIRGRDQRIFALRSGLLPRTTEPVSTARLLQYVRSHLAESITDMFEDLNVKPAISANVFERHVVPRIEADLKYSLKGIGRQNGRMNVVGTIAGWYEIVIVMLAVGAGLMLLARAMLGLPMTIDTHRLLLQDSRKHFWQSMVWAMSLPASAGLLGTVWGMISALAASEQEVVRSGIATAVGTTFVGAAFIVPLGLMYISIGSREQQLLNDNSLAESQSSVPTSDGLDVDTRVLAALECLPVGKQLRKVSVAEVANAAKLTTPVARNVLKRLEEYGAIVRYRNCRRGRPCVYEVTRTERDAS